MNRKGFTLIEMLVVIVLMGVIMTLAIPSVMRIMETKSSQEMDTHLKLLEQAANMYKSRYRGEFTNNPDANCFILDYQMLIEEELIEEQDINCTGYITFTKNAKKNYIKDYYLNCNDKNNVEFSKYELSDVPTGCVRLGEDTEIGIVVIDAPTIKGGNKNWVPTDVEISVENSGIDISNVKHYEYYKSSSGTKPSRFVTPSGTTSNTVTISDAGTTYIWYRVVDKTGNVSGWSNREIVNIDKETPPVPTITPSDGIASGNLHTNNFILTFGGSDNISGNTYYYGLTTDPTEVATAIEVTPEYNGKRIYVKSCSGAILCSDTKSYVVNIEVPQDNNNSNNNDDSDAHTLPDMPSE